MELNHSSEKDTLVLCADVDPLDENDKPETLRSLLIANLTREDIADAYFALSPGGRSVALCRALECDDIDGSRVFSELEALVTATRLWRQRLAHSHSAPAATPSFERQHA